MKCESHSVASGSERWNGLKNGGSLSDKLSEESAFGRRE